MCTQSIDEDSRLSIFHLCVVPIFCTINPQAVSAPLRGVNMQRWADVSFEEIDDHQCQPDRRNTAP